MTQGLVWVVGLGWEFVQRPPAGAQQLVSRIAMWHLQPAWTHDESQDSICVTRTSDKLPEDKGSQPKTVPVAWKLER
jgi:hypothetical protein